MSQAECYSSVESVDDGDGTASQDELSPNERRRRVLGRSLAAVALAALAVAALLCACSSLGSGQHATVKEVFRSVGRHSDHSPRRLVGELYTFGSPGTSLGGLYDASTANGCIPGLRVFSRSERSGMASLRPVADPVSWITAQFNFTHPRMEALEVSDQNVRDNPVHPCTAARLDPQSDDFWWMSGHVIYESVLKAHVDFLGRARPLRSLRGADPGSMKLHDRLTKAHLMIHFAFMVYSPHVQAIGVDAPDWGWNLVGHATSATPKPEGLLFSVLHRDQVTLYQQEDSLECALVFEGTDRDDQSDILSDIDISTEDFCGFGPAHKGFKGKLVEMLRSQDYVQVIHPKLSACAGLTVAGHSLGGAQAELFVACANHPLNPGEPGYEDHRLVHFRPAAVRKLPAFYEQQAPGSFLRNKGSGLCLDVSGTMETHSGAAIGLWECETSDGNYSRDQHWTLTEMGYLTNSLSGKCAAPSGANPELAGSELRQWKCEFGVGVSSSQRWEHTSEGFLKHILTGKCLDSHLAMYPCPHTDQLWQMLSDGHIVNRMSGKCLHVAGSAVAEEGAEIVIFRCDYSATTGQRWEISPSGAVRNRISGKCLQWQSNQKMSLHLATCQPQLLGVDLSLELGSDGFARSQENGLCLNVDGQPGTNDGTPVNLAACEDVHIETSGLWKRMPGGFLRNVGTDWKNQQKCIEVFGRTTDEKVMDGAPIHLDFCEIDTDQKWEVTEGGFVKSTIGGRKCLDVNSDADNPHSALRLQSCAQWSDPAEYVDVKWQLTPDGQIQNKRSLRCITLLAQPAGDVDLRPCGGSLAGRQRWDFRHGDVIVSRQNGHCLGFRSDTVQDVAPLELRPCGETDRQQWTLTPEGFLQGGRRATCLLQRQGPEHSLAAGVCPSTMQRWEILDNGLFQNCLTGLCVNAEFDGNRVPRLATRKCNPEIASQQWEKVDSSRQS